MTDNQRRALRTLVETAVAAAVAFGLIPDELGTHVQALTAAVLSTVFAFVAGAVEDRTGRSVAGPRKGSR